MSASGPSSRAGALTTLLLATWAFAAVGAARAETVVTQWNQTLMECIRRSRIGPPMLARAIGEVHTCGFDAWAMYDEVAVGTRLGPEFRRPASERTEANRATSIRAGSGAWWRRRCGRKSRPTCTAR